MSEKAIAAAGLRFKPGTHPTFVNVFSNPNGGFFKRINHEGKNGCRRRRRSIAASIRSRSISRTSTTRDNQDRHHHRPRLYESSKDGKLYTAPEGR
jgi:hypothetical protein